MRVLIIGSKAWKELIGRIEKIEQAVESEQAKNVSSIEWVDGETVCRYLSISPRTLQRLRSRHIINYSVLNRKIYYTIGEINRVLSERLVQRKI